MEAVARHRPAHSRSRHTPQPTVLARGEATERGTVKWFDPVKGYGFIKAGAGDVFIHANILRRYGISGVDLANTPGRRVLFKSAPGVVNDTPQAVAIFVD